MLARWLRPAPLLASLGLLAPALGAQTTIGLDDVRDHINRHVTVEATVARVTRSGRDTWISLGKAYPSAPLVIVIPASLASTIPDLQSYRGKIVRVTGLIRPSVQEAPPGRTRMPGDASRGRAPSRPFILLEDPGMLVLTGSAP